MRRGFIKIQMFFYRLSIVVLLALLGYFAFNWRMCYISTPDIRFVDRVLTDTVYKFVMSRQDLAPAEVITKAEVVSTDKKKYTRSGVAGIFDRLRGRQYWHIVKKDETVYRIAKEYGTTVDRILELNNMTTPDIIEGEPIYVGAPEERVDTSYAYDKTVQTFVGFSDSLMEASVEIISTDTLLGATPRWRYKGAMIAPSQDPASITVGGSLSDDRVLSGFAMYTTKSDWSFGGKYGLVGGKRFEVMVGKTFDLSSKAKGK